MEALRSGFGLVEREKLTLESPHPVSSDFLSSTINQASPIAIYHPFMFNFDLD